MSAQQSAWIVETNDAAFDRDVIERSRELPIVVDFWAEWCQPCRMLGPILEQLAREFAGKFVLVKADTERTQQAAMQFGVQSIPAVFFIHQGQPVDFFNGVMPEAQLRAWLERLLPTEADELTEEGRRLAASDPQAAEAKYREAIDANAKHVAARTALAELLLAQDRNTEAAEVLAPLEQRGYLEPEAEKVKAKLELQTGSGSADLQTARAQAERNPDDLPAQLTLAKTLAASGHYEEAFEVSLGLVERDRLGVGEEARAVMVDIFQVLPPDSTLVRDYRRKLSMALY